MICNFYKGEDSEKKSSLFRKLLEEIPDMIFMFIIAPDNNYYMPLVSESIDEMFELSADDIPNIIMFYLYDRKIGRAHV